MLQRQIMYKQLQELQRRQQLQDLGGGRNQDYVSLKQASGIQFAPVDNGASAHDSQMLMVDNMQMMQQGDSSIFQGFPSGLVLSQSHGNALGSTGLSPSQFGTTLYNNTPAPNGDKNLNQYSHLQDASNRSVNLLTKNTNSPSGMSSMHPSGLASSYTSQQDNFSSDQISMPGMSFLPRQMYQVKNLFGGVPFQDSDSDHLSLNYPSQGITTQRNSSVVESEGRHEDGGWPAISTGKVSKIGMSEADASLDPLEQKILYGTDDHSWESSNNKLGAGGFECAVENPSFMDTSPSMLSGSWSALMQSAVAETSSSDTAVQEEWSGLSFQNPEPSSDNHLSNFINSEKPQNNWVDRNLQSVASPSSEPEQLFQKSSMKCSFPGFQQSGRQYLNQKDEFQTDASHASGQNSPSSIHPLADYNSQLKHPTQGSQLVQSSLASQGHELKDTLWLHGSSSNSEAGGLQTQFNQLNQLNIHRYSLESQKVDSEENADTMSAHLRSSPDLHGQNVSAHSHPESRGYGFRQGPASSGTPQSYSLFPSLSMGNSSVASLPSHYEKDRIKNHHPAPPSHLTAKIPAYSAAPSQMNFQLKSSNSGGSGFPLLENAAVAQSSGASALSQRLGFPTPWPDVTSQQDHSSPRANRFSPSLFQSHGSASSSRETSLGAPNEQPSQNCFKHESNVGYEQNLENVSSIHDGLTEIGNPTPPSRHTDAQLSLRKHYSEVDGAASGSLMIHSIQQPSDQTQQKDDNTPIIPAGDISSSGHSLHQNYLPQHQLHYPRDSQTDYGKRFPFKYEGMDYQQVAKARELLLSGQKYVVQDKSKGDLDVAQDGVLLPGENKGWNFSQEVQEDQSGKASSAAYLQNFQQMEMLGQGDSQNTSIDSSQVSNAAYQSQINLQMAPSWFKHYGTLNDGQVLPMINPIAAANATQPFSGLSIGKLQENSLLMQVNSANASQGSGVWSSPAATLTASKHLSPSSMLPSDVMYQNLAVSNLKKRKIAFDLVPWHKEVNSEAPWPQNISVAELEWAQASNRRPEEATNEAEIVDDVLPLVRGKRRLTFTSQLMQQIFRPAPADILFEDASSNCEYLSYCAARLALGDACNLNTKLPSDTNDMSSEKLKTSKRTTTCDFSKVVEAIVSRVSKLEGDLSRLDRSLSIVDIKVESQELEKFSTLNRFAKFHIKPHPNTIDPALSSGPSAMQKATPRRYVVAVQMPKILPEGTDCLPL